MAGWCTTARVVAPPARARPLPTGPRPACALSDRTLRTRAKRRGQASTYEVLFVDDRICAEMMLSEWMRPFLDPAIRTIALVQQMLALGPIPVPRSLCGLCRGRLAADRRQIRPPDPRDADDRLRLRGFARGADAARGVRGGAARAVTRALWAPTVSDLGRQAFDQVCAPQAPSQSRGWGKAMQADDPLWQQSPGHLEVAHASRWLLSFAALLILAPSVADAAILIDARRQGNALRVVIDAERQRALIVTPRGQSVVDLERGRIYLRQGAGGGRQIPIERRDVTGRVSGHAVGARSGHATVYHVITYHDEICAEMLVSGWTQPFIAPVVQALDLLDGMPAPAQGGGWAHSVRLRRGRLADAGREDRPSDLRDQGDPVRLRLPARRAVHERRRLADRDLQGDLAGRVMAELKAGRSATGFPQGVAANRPARREGDPTDGQRSRARRHSERASADLSL